MCISHKEEFPAEKQRGGRVWTHSLHARLRTCARNKLCQCAYYGAQCDTHMKYYPRAYTIHIPRTHAWPYTRSVL